MSGCLHIKKLPLLQTMLALTAEKSRPSDSGQRRRSRLATLAKGERLLGCVRAPEAASAGKRMMGLSRGRAASRRKVRCCRLAEMTCSNLERKVLVSACVYETVCTSA